MPPVWGYPESRTRAGPRAAFAALYASLRYRRASRLALGFGSVREPCRLTVPLARSETENVPVISVADDRLFSQNLCAKFLMRH
jgi:hypothetical protein